MSPRPPHALTPRRIREVAEVFFPTMSAAICPRCRERYLPIGDTCICRVPFERRLTPADIARRAARPLAGRKGNV